MNFDEYLAENCRYCETVLPKPFLDLGTSPLANNFPTKEALNKEEARFPLALSLCPSCRLVQLSHIVPPDLMFKNYLYVSSTTKTFQKHFADYAGKVAEKLEGRDNPLAVDIGSNDGLLLSYYQDKGMRTVGVDPAENLAEEANQNGLQTICRYFDKEAVELIKAEHGAADVVSGNNVFAHIGDIQSVMRNVVSLIKEDGFFVVEFPYFVTMVEELLFDMIYHEHLSYIAIAPLSMFAKTFKMQIFDIEPVSSHGGSLRVYMQKEGGPFKISGVVTQFLELEKQRGYLDDAIYAEFAEKVMGVKQKLRDAIEAACKAGGRVAGYGAPAKATTILNFCELTVDNLDYVVDDNPLKQERFVPGTRIPIVSSEHLEAEPPSLLVIFAWNFATEILNKIGHLQDKGVRFIVPLPQPRTVLPDPPKSTLSP